MTHSTPASPRADGRRPDELRPLAITCGVMRHPEGSAEIVCGDTKVLVAATVESRVPSFLAGSGKGWITAEYAMLPRATASRSPREVQQGRPSGRTAEIQRLIGRSLRAAVDLAALGERTLTIDCDVLEADAGTRTAAITGAWVAATAALAKLFVAGDLPRWPLVDQVVAVSVGVVDGVAVLDLDYREDQRAEVDMNVVATASGRLVEVQGTGERGSFAREELDRLLDLAFSGVARLAEAQRAALGERLDWVNERQEKGRRPKTAPKDERELWGPPPRG